MGGASFLGRGPLGPGLDGYAYMTGVLNCLSSFLSNAFHALYGSESNCDGSLMFSFESAAPLGGPIDGADFAGAQSESTIFLLDCKTLHLSAHWVNPNEVEPTPAVFFVNNLSPPRVEGSGLVSFGLNGFLVLGSR